MAEESNGVSSAAGGSSRAGTILVYVAGVVLVAFCVLLRFWTTSPLWLDEALTVNIARLPLHAIPGALRRDGAPPLFYVILHYWMGWFGDSTPAVRALPGLFGVATIPLIWRVGARLGGPRNARVVGGAAVILLATNPYAVYYDTDVRMYSLVAFLCVLGILAAQRLMDTPRAGNVIALGVLTGLLLYTHYWALYLIALSALWFGWRVWRRQGAQRRSAAIALGALGGGCLSFLPWLPIFLFQEGHTGTPWALPANFSAMLNAIATFAGGPTNQGRALALLFFALVGLGIFGIAKSPGVIELDLRTQPSARGLAVVLFGTLLAATIGGYLTHSAFASRYAAVVFIPLLLLAALGIATFAEPAIRLGVVGLVVLCGLLGAIPNVHALRTQAGEVAATLSRLGQPGDVVGYCPDQLGPDVSRLLPPGRYRQITFPRETGPEFVNWVDYAQATMAGHPAVFARVLETLAGDQHQIWLVWAPGYETYGTKCEAIESSLLADQGFGAHEQFPYDSEDGEQMELVRFAPRR
jgi:hypothetical protein